MEYRMDWREVLTVEADPRHAPKSHRTRTFSDSICNKYTSLEVFVKLGPIYSFASQSLRHSENRSPK